MKRKAKTARVARRGVGRSTHADVTDVPRAQRIYVNRNLRLASVRAIGFDMDHTLATYKPLPFERLAFEKAKGKLIERGYSNRLRQLTYDHDFVVRGLIVDKRRGNILKLDRHHYVVQAYHGTRKLPAEMRKKLYTRRRLRVTGTTLAPIDTLFSIPEISLYAQVVDLADQDETRPNYRQLYHDVRAVMDEAHADGSIKNAIARAPMRYLDVDENLPATLNRILTHGMKLFLLTNSETAYTKLVMDRLLSRKLVGRPHWTDFFDLVVVRAKKPGFFARRDPLRPLSARALGLKRGKRPRFTFTGGSVGGLERALGVAGDGILYFGDHTYGDIMKSKRACGWRTAMIIRKLEEELQELEAAREQWKELEALERRADRIAAGRDFLERALDGEVPADAVRRFLRERGLPGNLRLIRSHLETWHEQMNTLTGRIAELEAEVEAGFNLHWGPIFRAGREISHFGNQVEEFACIYTSRVSNFLNYPMDKYFVTSHVFMPHEG